MTPGSLVAWKSSRRIRSLAVSLMRRRLPHGWLASQVCVSLRERPLEQDYVTPFAVERSVAQVRPDHSKARALEQSQARLVVREQLADQLVEAAPRGLVGELRKQRAADPAFAQLGVDVDAALGDAPVDLARPAVFRHRRPARDATVELGHEEGVALRAEAVGVVLRVTL